MKMAANFIKITVRGNEEYSFIFENNFTLIELGRIFLVIIMYLVLIEMENFISSQFMGI
jgi:hypothetical protein